MNWYVAAVSMWRAIVALLAALGAYSFVAMLMAGGCQTNSL